MAHRGRLNVLANILDKPFAEIFNEFEDNYLPQSTHDGDGDVKYHLGFSADVADRRRRHGPPVASRPTPATWRSSTRWSRAASAPSSGSTATPSARTGVPILIHGDAAFAGQGVVVETFNLSHLAGYKTGGTIHVVVNNQIGFTTNPRDSPQHAVLHRRRQDDPGADLPRQRRGPRGVRLRRASWRWSSASSSSATSSSTWSATASGATTRATTRPTRSRCNRR